MALLQKLVTLHAHTYTCIFQFQVIVTLKKSEDFDVLDKTREVSADGKRGGYVSIFLHFVPGNNDVVTH